MQDELHPLVVNEVTATPDDNLLLLLFFYFYYTRSHSIEAKWTELEVHEVTSRKTRQIHLWSSSFLKLFSLCFELMIEVSRLIMESGKFCNSSKSYFFKKNTFLPYFDAQKTTQPNLHPSVKCCRCGGSAMIPSKHTLHKFACKLLFHFNIRLRIFTGF